MASEEKPPGPDARVAEVGDTQAQGGESWLKRHRDESSDIASNLRVSWREGKEGEQPFWTFQMHTGVLGLPGGQFSSTVTRQL